MEPGTSQNRDERLEKSARRVGWPVEQMHAKPERSLASWNSSSSPSNQVSQGACQVGPGVPKRTAKFDVLFIMLVTDTFYGLRAERCEQASEATKQQSLD